MQSVVCFLYINVFMLKYRPLLSIIHFSQISWKTARCRVQDRTAPQTDTLTYPPRFNTIRGHSHVNNYLPAAPVYRKTFIIQHAVYYKALPRVLGVSLKLRLRHGLHDRLVLNANTRDDIYARTIQTAGTTTATDTHIKHCQIQRFTLQEPP